MLALGGTHIIAVLDLEGNIVVGRVVSANNELQPMITTGSFQELPIVRSVLASSEALAATEILPAEILRQFDLDGQGLIPLVDTPKAASQPFDPREGSAGLALMGVHPLVGRDGNLQGRCCRRIY